MSVSISQSGYSARHGKNGGLAARPRPYLTAALALRESARCMANVRCDSLLVACSCACGIGGSGLHLFLLHSDHGVAHAIRRFAGSRGCGDALAAPELSAARDHAHRLACVSESVRVALRAARIRARRYSRLTSHASLHPRHEAPRFAVSNVHIARSGFEHPLQELLGRLASESLLHYQPAARLVAFEYQRQGPKVRWQLESIVPLTRLRMNEYGTRSR